MAQYTFIDNKYTRWYYQLIDNRRQNKPPKGCYTESHHIIPESFYIKRTREGTPGWLDGNPNARSNKVRLTGREHALCHWLLTKMTVNDTRANELMVYAFNMMDVGGDHMGRSTSAAIVRAYERNREVWAKNHSRLMKKQFEEGRVVWNKGKKLEDEKYRVGGRKNKGLKRSDETKALIGAVKVGKKQSAETSEKKRIAMTGFVRGPMSDEEKLKRSQSQVGVAKSDVHADNIAAGVRGNISINKDGVEKKVKQPQLQSFLDDGWKKGGLARKRKVEA